MVRTIAAATAAVLLLSAGAAAAQMRPGQWEVTVATEIPGLPPGMPAPQKTQHCYSEAEARQPERMAQRSQDGCKMIKSQQKGATYEFEMRCTNPAATSRGHYTFAEESYDGVVQMEMQEGDAKMAITTRLQGRRLGDCPR